MENGLPLATRSAISSCGLRLQFIDNAEVQNVHECDAFCHVTLLPKKGKMCVSLQVVNIVSSTKE